MQEPDYSSYSLEELKDVLRVIDRDNYPDRVLKAQNEIKLRESDKLPEEGVKSKPAPEQAAPKKQGKKSARVIVLAIWPALVFLSIYFGKLPSRNGFVTYDENPGLFVFCIMIFIGVGIYFYNGRDDIDT